MPTYTDLYYRADRARRIREFGARYGSGAGIIIRWLRWYHRRTGHDWLGAFGTGPR